MYTNSLVHYICLPVYNNETCLSRTLLAPAFPIDMDRCSFYTG